MLAAMTLILSCQLAGEAAVLATGVPIPGPVVGMLLLLAILLMRRGPGEALDGTASTLLSHLSLLFVPAGVGIMVHWDRIGSQWLALSAALLVSTLVGLAVTALVMQAMMRMTGVSAGHGARGSREDD